MDEKAEDLVEDYGDFNAVAASLKQMLSDGKVKAKLGMFARFLGQDASSFTFDIHPVWAPDNASFEAVAYGERIIVNIPEGKPVGSQHAALIVHEMGRRMLARLPETKKVLYTNRFAEEAGHKGGPLALVEGVLDGLSHGIVAPLLAEQAADIPVWPGDDARKRFAETMTELLKKQMSGNKQFDTRFVSNAASRYIEVNDSKPFDYLHGAMVVAEESVIEIFKTQVVRWMIWKFPPSKKYNYKRKLDDNPGKTMVIIMRPKDFPTLPARFSKSPKITAAMDKASSYLKRGKSVVVTVPRQSRGYIFVLGARNEEAMKRLARAFFALKYIPLQPFTTE